MACLFIFSFIFSSSSEILSCFFLHSFFFFDPAIHIPSVSTPFLWFVEIQLRLFICFLLDLINYNNFVTR